MANAGRPNPSAKLAHDDASLGTGGSAPPQDAGGTAVAAYKTILQRVLDNRPSGTRLKLAAVLGKNRSFVSQITNPSYAVPLPARHVPAVLDACHLSATDREQFLKAYEAAHPERRGFLSGRPSTRTLTLTVPDFGDARRNRAYDQLLSDMAERLGRFGGAER